MSNNDNKKKSNINIEIDEKIAEGTYSNLAIINHSVSEFVLDLGLLSLLLMKNYN